MFADMDLINAISAVAVCVLVTSSVSATRLFGEGGCGEDSANCSVLHPSRSPSEHDQRSRFEIFAGGGKDAYDHDSTGGPPHNSHDPYEKGEGKMWLVPPFLIGACSVILIYIVVHCLYLHCYAKRKMQHMQPTLVFSDDGSNSSLQAFTPYVKYDASFGQTELLVCRHSFEDTRRKSSHLQLPFFKHNKPRLSTSSAGSVLESTPPVEGEEPARNTRGRASICLVPVGRKSSSKEEWLPLQSFMCQGNMLNVSTQPPSSCPRCGCSKKDDCPEEGTSSGTLKQSNK
ncbi:hypothetical protein CAPTEDRAFT_210204 [Capitella teleta]|uniref:Uncharacterized protein n=1 Tax=Capitella teleta TaxID=283909 RepID=R7TVB4_CAPTE|nr:hypothetical protein CAPTEDRAFT_210204 [Capitella teleta]|eukprot:ELT97803.1 hypothetical protein CAPTEDRAFT_210204 [Capitella teleta]